MSAYLVKPTETFAAPAERLGLELWDDDGDYAKLFFQGGPWEITVTDAARDEDGRRLVIPLGFHSKEHAQRAGEVLTTAFEIVRGLQKLPGPDPETCLHEPVAMRFRRKMPKVWVCERCTATLGEVAEEVSA